MTTTVDLVAMTGVTYRRLDFWTRRGYLHPTNPEPGIGHERHYPLAEAAVAVRMAELVKAGLTIHTAHTVARGDPTTITTLLRAIQASAHHLTIDYAPEECL
jgi:DNA-binding transcriptional MerR regulator